MLIETVLAMLVVTVITSTALSLFSSLLLNVQVGKIASDVQMCQLSRSGDHTDFTYKEGGGDGEQVAIIGPVTETANVIDRALKKLADKYSSCKFKGEGGQEMVVEAKSSRKLTGYFYIGSQKA